MLEVGGAEETAAPPTGEGLQLQSNATLLNETFFVKLF